MQPGNKTLHHRALEARAEKARARMQITLSRPARARILANFAKLEKDGGRAAAAAAPSEGPGANITSRRASSSAYNLSDVGAAVAP